MSKKKTKKSVSQKKVNNENIEDEKDLVRIKADNKTEEKVQEKDTVIHEDNSFENLFEKEMSEKKVKDKAMREKYREEKAIAIEREKKNVKHPFVHSFLVLVLLTSLAYFIISLFFTNNNSIVTLINGLLLMLFTIIFVSVAITTNRKNKNGFFLSSFILFGYFVFGILMTLDIITFPSMEVRDFTGKELTEVIKWSEKNDVKIVQDYEYSDMISEYHIIGQDVKAGTKVKDVKTLTVAVSEGPNPGKELVIPNMVSWDSERVLEFIKENHLTNVYIDFIESAKPANTVVEQNKSGNMRRDDELKLIFSYGEELQFSEVKLRDLSGMSKFEAMFYLKQNHLNYEFKDVFSSDVKKGFVVSQSIKPGKMVKVDGETVVVSISKGPEIKVPNLTNMSMTEVTEWVIKNKLKLEFTDMYDDTVKENGVISANYKEGDKVAEGDLIKVVVSRGKLKMGKFDDFSQFREWAEKYGVKYEEQHEFSDSVNAGEVISYSYKDGETIKNNDTVIVVISDGKEVIVPDVVGSTKNQASSKLKNAGFNYNFVYACNNNVESGKVVRQSLRAGSKASQGTTVTVTVSTGKCASKPSGGGSNGGSSGGGSTPPPKPVCNSCFIRPGELKSIIISNTGNFVNAANAVKSFITGRCSGVNVQISPDSSSGLTPGSYVSGWEGGNFNSCDTIRITLAQ